MNGTNESWEMKRKRLDCIGQYQNRLRTRYNEVARMFKKSDLSGNMGGYSWEPSAQDVLDIIYELKQLTEETGWLMKSIMEIDVLINEAEKKASIVLEKPEQQ